MEMTFVNLSIQSNNIKMVRQIRPYLLWVMFNELRLCKYKLYSFTYSAVTNSCLETNRNHLFLPRSSVLKFKIKYFCLKQDRSSSYTCTVYFASQPIIRSHTANTTNTDVKRPPRYTCSSDQNPRLNFAQTDTSSSTCQIVTLFYSTTVFVRTTLVHFRH